MDSANNKQEQDQQIQYFLDICQTICGIIQQPQNERSELASQMVALFPSDDYHGFDSLKQCLKYCNDVVYYDLVRDMPLALQNIYFLDARVICFKEDMPTMSAQDVANKLDELTTLIIGEIPSDLQ